MKPRAPRLRRFIGLVALGLLPMLAAHADECRPRQEEVVNRDGSRLHLLAHCAGTDDAGDGDGGNSSFEVAYAPPGASRFRTPLAIGPDGMGEPPRHARFVDLDQDGFFEVEARGMCGAGPNCLGDLYRLDPASGELQHFFSGGYAELQVLDGHLIEGGRASCCAWEYHAWRMDAAPRLRHYDNMELMVTVGADPGSDRDDAPARCTFSRRSGDNWRVVAPPGAAWLSLCRTYGDDFHLVTPEQARAAEAANAQEA